MDMIVYESPERAAAEFASIAFARYTESREFSVLAPFIPVYRVEYSFESDDVGYQRIEGKYHKKYSILISANEPITGTIEVEETESTSERIIGTIEVQETDGGYIPVSSHAEPGGFSALIQHLLHVGSVDIHRNKIIDGLEYWELIGFGLRVVVAENLDLIYDLDKRNRFNRKELSDFLRKKLMASYEAFRLQGEVLGFPEINIGPQPKPGE